MPKVFTSSNLIEIKSVQNLIEAAGIATRIRNEHTGTMLPLGDLTAMELWVKEDRHADEGKAIAAEYQAAQQRQGDEAPWFCNACKESNPANFDVCWNCGAEKAG